MDQLIEKEGHSPVIVINAQPSSDVEVLDVKALVSNLPSKSDHDVCRFFENVHLSKINKLTKPEMSVIT